MAGLGGRMSTVVKAKISKLLDRAEDPAETLDYGYQKQLELLRNMREQLAGYDEEELRAAVDPTVGLDDVDRDNISAVRREADFTAKSAQSLERHAVELEKALAALPQGENPSALSDRLEAARAELGTLREKLDAYLLACEKLGEASENLRTSVSPRLASDAAKLMAHITDGKYTEIGVGGDLGMTALTDSGTRSISVLSAGTKADDIRRELREGRRRAIGKAADTRRGKGAEHNFHLERPRRKNHARGREIPRDTAVSQYRV